MDKWAMKFDKCIICGTTTIKHEVHGKCIKCYSKEHNKEYYYKEDKKPLWKKYSYTRWRKCRKSWIGFFPEKTQCQVCGKTLYYCTGDKRKSICFDHKDEKEYAIMEAPANWLAKHVRSPKTEAIWNSCNFGILCLRCNLKLPTKDRKEYIKKVWKYVFEY